jgi:hypothetical protein
MKAIQIKYLPATNFKGSRMKAWTEGGNSITVPFQYEISDDLARAQDVAQELINKMGWDAHSKITGMGTLPNGDWVATLGGK